MSAAIARVMPMRRAVGPFFRLPAMLVSNVWVLDGGPGDRWLVDCGHWSERLQLLAALARLPFDARSLTGVLLTHRHSDHAGNAAFLQARLGLRVYAHAADAEVLEGRSPRPHMSTGRDGVLAGLITHFENRWPARVAIERALDDGDRVGGLEVHWVPGHTEGSALYRHLGSGALLSGDTLLNAIPPLVRRVGLSLSHPTFSLDNPRAARSMARWQARGLAYEHVLAGHGPPLVGDARRRVDAFLHRQGALAVR